MILCGLDPSHPHKPKPEDPGVRATNHVILSTRNRRGTNAMHLYKRGLQALPVWAGEDSNLRLTDYEGRLTR